MTVRETVQRERQRVVRLTVLAGAGIAIAATLLLLATGAALFSDARWLALPRALPLALWLAIAVIDGAVAWWVWRRMRATTLASVAGTIEQEQAMRAGAVRGALEVGDGGALGRRAALAAASDLAGRGPVLAPSMRRRSGRRAAIASAAACAAAIVAIGVAPLFGDGLLAVLEPVDAYHGSLVPALAFRGLPSDVLRGEPLRLEVTAPGRTTVDVSYRVTGSGWRTERASVRGGTASVLLGAMRGTVQIVAADGRTMTDTAVVAVAERPFVGAATMRAVYPAYLQRAGETLPASGRVQVPRGTTLLVSGQSSVALRRIGVAAGRDTIAMHADGHTFGGRITAESSRAWTWVAVAPQGAVDVPEPLVLDVIPDSAPVVELLMPATDTAVAPGSLIGVRIAAGDDRGLAAVLLEVRVERAGGLGSASRQVVASPPGDAWEGSVEIDPATLRGLAGDVLHVRALATDASPWAQQGASRTVHVRLRTSEERRDVARQLGDSAVAAADAAARAQRDLARRTEEAARARDRGAPAATPRTGATPSDAPPPAMSHEAGERARTIAQEQRQLVEKVEALRDAAAQLEKGLKEAGALDSSLSRQLREAQDLMRQALSPELMAQMQRLEQAAQQLDSKEARDAMRDLAQMQQRMREQLEQSAEMLKRAAHEGAMQTLRDEAREIAAQQRALGDSAARGRNEAARGAEALADRSERYAADVQALQERLARDRANAAAEGTSEARRSAERAEERLREATPATGRTEAQRDASAGAPQPQLATPNTTSQQANANTAPQQARPNAAPQQATPNTPQQQRAGAGTPQQATPNAGSPQRAMSGAQQQQLAEGARDAAAQMDQAAQAMQQARDAQVREWKQELTAELDRAVQETLQMAREERALEQQARSGAGREELRSRQSSVQQGVDKTGDRLRDAGKRTSLLSGGAQRAMAEAREKVQAATRELAQGAGAGQGTQGQGTQAQASALAEAAESLNRAAASLARDRQRANGASSASGFSEMMQQLQEMAKRQGSINAGAQSLMQMPGGQQSPQGAQVSRALARQQRQVAQELDDVSEEVGGGRTAELAREARQLAEALDAGRLDARTAARQEQLFKRLLDAGRALEKEEREDADRREARAATNAPPGAVEGGATRGRDARRFREPTWDELRGLTAEERRAIIEYFRRINAEGRP